MESSMRDRLSLMTQEEKELTLKIMRELSLDGRSKTLELLNNVDYDEVPVSIDQFIEDDRYMGKVFENGKLIYPFWRNFLHDLFHNNVEKRFEVAVSGAIGTGKSTISAIALMYLLYRTMCLKDPQKFYGLTANSPIVFVVLNLTLDLAYQGLYSMMVEAIKLSPWFCERVDIRGKYEFSIEFPKNIGLMVGSNVQHTIGKNVLGAILDEVNFSKAPKGSKNSVLDMYRNIRRRLESRFLKQGRIPGLLFLVSSKNSDLDFLEQYIQSIKHQKTTIVIDRAVYEIKPPETYTGERFNVAVGDKTKQSRILNSTEDLESAKQQGYRIISVPVEYRIAFEQDINDALKDISGISSVTTNKLIPYAGKIESIINYNRRSPFMLDQLTLGLNSNDDIKDYIEDLRLLKEDIHLPRFIHCDIGLKNDALGLSMVHSDRQTSINRYTKEGKIESIIENHYVADFTLTIKALAGSEIPLFKVREFIIWLATTLGLHIQLVTFDGFQSADSIQLLKVAGLEAALQSVDRSADPYLNLRSCVLENRLELYNDPILIKELYDLEYDRKANKIDHPLEGSKDTSDSLCGALWGAQNYYASKRQTNVIQHQRVDMAVKFISDMNKKRWASNNNNNLIEENSWLYKD